MSVFLLNDWNSKEIKTKTNIAYMNHQKLFMLNIILLMHNKLKLSTRGAINMKLHLQCSKALLTVDTFVDIHNKFFRRYVMKP